MAVAEAKRSKRSRTAQGVAAERALLADMGVLPDPFARRMLSPTMAATYEFVRRWPLRVRARSVTLCGLAARVLWFDARVTEALDDGIDQVAVIGAGYDSRAWRLRRDGVQFFELDHPATQRDKARRAPGPGPSYVEADLTTDDVAEGLAGHGLDASRPALFVVEGVTMYLGEDVVRRQFGALAGSSARGSRLLADFLPPRQEESVRDHRQRRLQHLARLGSGEGFRLTLDPAEAVALVEASGWIVGEATSLRDAAQALVPRPYGLPVDAVNQDKTLVAARLG